MRLVATPLDENFEMELGKFQRRIVESVSRRYHVGGFEMFRCVLAAKVSRGGGSQFVEIEATGEQAVPRRVQSKQSAGQRLPAPD
jgi:hypothetical protein